jgi:hypothetical protein
MRVRTFLPLALFAFSACAGSGEAPVEPTPRDLGKAKDAAPKCPATKRIDCMPMVKKEMREHCEPARIRWIAANCPDIQITF